MGVSDDWEGVLCRTLSRLGTTAGIVGVFRRERRVPAIEGPRWRAAQRRVATTPSTAAKPSVPSSHGRKRRGGGGLWWISSSALCSARITVSSSSFTVSLTTLLASFTAPLAFLSAACRVCRAVSATLSPRRCASLWARSRSSLATPLTAGTSRPSHSESCSRTAGISVRAAVITGAACAAFLSAPAGGARSRRCGRCRRRGSSVLSSKYME
mmetsp:Transcript_33403/g.68874  ORF Transcript_33403/g.68874 Transcript_33403/m.68874 type:complete len:212 (+) Transcript_33403:521-1156(+)